MTKNINKFEDDILNFIIENPGIKLFNESDIVLDKKFDSTTNIFWDAFDNLINRGEIIKTNEEFVNITIEWLYPESVQVIKNANVYPAFSSIWIKFLKRDKHD